MHKHLLSDIALFIEVVHTKSFTEAAERIGMPASTLSRRISALEAAIGFRLLNRTTRKVDVTDEGSAYFHRCKHLLEEAALAHEAISDTIHKASGVLRLACTADFANLYLAPVLASFAREHPAVNLELTLSSQVEDLVSRHLDVAIRMGPLRDSSLVAKPLGALAQGLYASAEYIARSGAVIQTPQDLATVDCIRLNASASGSVWSMAAVDMPQGSASKIAVSGRFVAGGPQLACQLALHGCGVALLGETLAQPYVSRGQLVRLLPQWQPKAVQVTALTTSRLLPARVRRFVEHVSQTLSAQ